MENKRNKLLLPISDVSQRDTLKISIDEIYEDKQSFLTSQKLMDILGILLPIIALFLWSISLQHVDVQKMNDLGLISVLSLRIIIALVILMISFGITLQRPHMRVFVLALHLILVIIMLYGMENLIEEAPRFAIVYRHAGYTEFISRTGTVNPNLDAYFSWPGFFILSAFYTRVAGYQTILSYAGWAPVFYNLIYFGPMYIIFTSMTTNKRLVWLSIWFFYITNWIGQDYFSPQGMNFFLYLVIIAILLKWFKISSHHGERTQIKKPVLNGIQSSFFNKYLHWLKASDPLITPALPWQQWTLLTIIILIFTFVVFSHPLTPFFVIVSAAALVVFRRCSPFWLPILMGIITTAWIFFMTRTFLSGHASMVIGNIGNIGSNVSSTVTSRASHGSPQHEFIALLRILMTATIWGLAALGVAVRLRKGYQDITYILLSIASFTLIGVQNYGGEMFLRVYLFTLPFMTFFAASLFCGKSKLLLQSISLFKTVTTVIVILILLSGFFFTRYGNERMDYLTYAEVEGIGHLYNIAPPKSLLIAGWDDTPWQFKDYEKYTCVGLTEVLPDAVINVNVNKLINYVKKRGNPNTYLIFTRSEKAQAYSLSGVPNGALDRLESAMLKTNEFQMVYENADVQIFKFHNNVRGG